MFLLSKNSKLISHSHELFTLLPPLKSGQHPIFVKTYNDCRILGHSSDLSFPSIQFPNSRKSIISNPTSHWTFALRQFLDKLTLNPFTKSKANCLAFLSSWHVAVTGLVDFTEGPSPKLETNSKWQLNQTANSPFKAYIILKEVTCK